MSRVTLGACGDISFSGKLQEHVKQRGKEFPFENVMQHFRSADVLFANLESVVVPEDFPHKAGLYCTDHIAESLKLARFDILNIANNHILDCGWQGLLHTYKMVKDMGAVPLGAADSQSEAKSMKVLDVKGIRIGFLGYQEPCNCTYEGGGGRLSYFDLSRAVEEIRENKPLVDILVVSLHADMEFNSVPSLLKVEACRKLADCGADIVLCHHPHVPQGVERWGDSLIAYSLGNFAFGIDSYQMNGYPNTLRSHILFIEIEDGRISNWYRKYFKIDKEECRPCILSEEEQSEAEQHYLYLDSILKNPEELRRLWHEASLRYLKLYWRILEKRGPEEFIRHYGFKIFHLSENRHWVEGIRELIQNEYDKNVHNDFEYKRPNSPFEG